MSLRQWTIQFVTRLVAWTHRWQTVVVRDSERKVNLGSGFQVAKGWIHMDASLNSFFARFPRVVLRLVYRVSGERENHSFATFEEILKSHRFVHHDVHYGLPFENNSLENVYSSHFLEHLNSNDGLVLLKEIHRVLRPKGRVRICVPDLEYVFRLYHGGEKEQALSYFFVPPHFGPLLHHKSMYDFEMLFSHLEKAGFSQIKQCRFQEGKTPDLAFLDNRPEETLYVEAIKN
ncbi:MAG: methyltransferase domain-containing protein [Elusimicrobia bacterium]|nr:methyltransferase domain-containing protein [Elusimicrobiota bacterium]